MAISLFIVLHFNGIKTNDGTSHGIKTIQITDHVKRKNLARTSTTRILDTFS